ncbi:MULTISPECIES: hypothetical protein [Streptomyces]|uniref:hypothetical protein n=1 Tax=Streptomyces TaxID=1883 RepID=UPI002F9155FD|nr:hypothetical protein OG215_36175 [Streptomyces globisporus]
MTRTEYGIASASRPGDIEPLGRLGLEAAKERLADSRAAWPDVYLVQRTGDTWQTATEAEED